MVLLVVIIFGVIAWLEIPGMVQKKYWRELIVYCALLLPEFVLSLLLTMGVNFPAVSTAIFEMVKSIFGVPS
jgi:hypothetical protein